MQIVKKGMKLLLAALSAFVLTACNSAGPAGPCTENEGGVSMLEDICYKSGLNLRRLHSTDKNTPMIIKRLDLLGDAVGETSSWSIAQWACRQNLADGREYREGDVYYYRDAGKAVGVNTKTPFVYLECNAGEQYDHPRRQGETWPHLLLQQDFKRRFWIRDYEHIYAEVTVTLNKFEDRMPAGSFDASLHAAQLQWFFTVQNHNAESVQYGDYLWLGVPFFDNRKEYPGGHQSVDSGQGDKVGTNKFIYSIDSREYLAQPVKEGVTVTIRYDILPQLKEAFAAAKSRNYLTATDFDDLSFGSTNFGWELPGIYDVAVTLSGIKLTGIKRG